MATLEDTVRRLLESGLPLVGWSLFDRDLVDKSNIDAALKEEWTSRYVNALADARRWRTKIHPSFKISRLHRFDPKHTLDRYAAFTGYPNVAALRGATPATWIRHLLKQVEARTHYRRITSEAKRDWHRLLEYNEHDCRALRHVHQRTAFEREKWRAYEKRTYYVHDGRRGIRFRVGSKSAGLDALLERYGAERWAFVTAWNPGSRPLPRRENDERQQEMIARLLAAGYRCLAGEGRGDDPSGPPQDSVLILDIPKRAARTIGRDFGQLAILVGYRRAPARLVACV